MRFAILALIVFSMSACQTGGSGTTSAKNEKAKKEFEQFCQAKIKIEGFEPGKATPVKRVEPNYPWNAANVGVQGCVFAAFDVDENGHPKNVRAIKIFPEGYGFEEQTLAAILKWRYEKEPKKNVMVKLDYQLN